MKAWALVVSFCVPLLSCTTAPKRPTTYTAAPSLRSASHEVMEAKDVLSRARTTNEKLRRELEQWGKEYK